MQFLVNIFAFVNPRFLKVEPTEIINSDNNFGIFHKHFSATPFCKYFKQWQHCIEMDWKASRGQYFQTCCFTMEHRREFCQFLSGGFTTMAVINPPERQLGKRNSVQCPRKPRKYQMVSASVSVFSTLWNLDFLVNIYALFSQGFMFICWHSWHPFWMMRGGLWAKA